MLGALVAHPTRPHLVLMARDAPALTRAVGTAHDRGLQARGIHIDLGDMTSIRHAFGELKDAADKGLIAPIDVAILNAGAQFASRRKVSTQRYELTFAVNVIAQHLMLRELEIMLSPSAHAVLMGSSTHRGKRASFNLVPDPSWDEPNVLAKPTPDTAEPINEASERTEGGVAYATSKLALVTLSHDWAARLAQSGRRLNTYDPGLVPGTGLGKDLPGAMYWVWKNLMPAMRVLPGASTPAISSRHAVDLAMGDSFGTTNDGYVEIGRLTEAEKVTFDLQRRRALWDWLEAAVAGTISQGFRSGE
jgi:NAD(P)-dependent dehydrogenase (short-subunit alcohol dehydrogenase family)